MSATSSSFGSFSTTGRGVSIILSFSSISLLTTSFTSLSISEGFSIFLLFFSFFAGLSCFFFFSPLAGTVSQLPSSKSTGFSETLVFGFFLILSSMILSFIGSVFFLSPAGLVLLLSAFFVLSCSFFFDSLDGDLSDFSLTFITLPLAELF